MSFKKKTENFVCDVCGKKVVGDGYTDHCPHCLWSRHVDINPGDRACDCHGLMEPIGMDKKRGEWKIIYKCQKCGERKICRAGKEDNLEMLNVDS